MASNALARLDRLTRYEALVKIAEEIVIDQNLNSLFERLAGLLRPVLGFDLALFSVNDSDRQSVAVHVVEKGSLSSQAVPLDAECQKWVSIPRIANPRDFPSGLKLLRDRGIQSYCSVPLTTAHCSVGSMGIGNERAHAYTSQDVEFLGPVAAQVAFAVNEDSTYRRLDVSEPNRQQEEDLWSLLERSPDYAIATLDRNYRVLTWNTGAHRLAGYSSEEIVGHNLAEFFPREYVAQAKADLRVAAEEGRNDVERWFVRRDGSRLWVNRMITALRDSRGRVSRFLMVSRDITQRKLAEEALLIGMADILGASSDVRNLVSLVSASIGHLIPHDGVTIARYNAEINKVQIIGASLDLKLTADELTESLEENPSGLVFRSGQPVRLDAVDTNRFPHAVIARLLNRGVKSGYWVPLISDGSVIGVLGITSAREGAFVDVNTSLVTHVANLVALAMSNNPAAFGTEEKEHEVPGSATYDFSEIVHTSLVVRRILAQVETVASTDATVLILGETGTGKELIARAIHRLSLRREHPFVILNCAAIPGGLLESDLFGHEKGAFTGAICQKIGRMELANYGTLFLDEVGDIPLELQPKLLRAVQEREFERLGSTRTIAVDMRLIAATNQNLEEMVKARQFRSDLYYRLKVFPITIPALRDRPEDIPILAQHFARKHAKRMGKRIEIIPPKAMEAMQRWHWPGNVRELENFIERAVILSQGRVLNIPTAEIRTARSTEAVPAAPAMLADAERETIISALRRTGGVIGGPNGAAAQLGLKRTTLNYKMRKLGITRDLCVAKNALGTLHHDTGMAEVDATRRRCLGAS
jgi:PAS domain S-box-containing protein